MKKLLLMLFTTVFLVLLAGCGEKKEEIQVNSPKNISIQIDGAAVPYYAPMYIAKEKGYFEEEGLNVEFYYAAAAEIVKNVATGNVQLGFPNADSVILAKSQGIPVKVINTTYQHGLGSLIFKSNSGITTPEDLKGKTVAVTSFGSPNYIQLKVMLEKVGLSINDVKVEIIGTGAIVNALVTDQVDAIMFSMLRTIELKNQGIDVAEIKADEFLPSHGNVLIVGDKFLKEDSQTIEKFNRALNKGIQYIIDGNSKESVELSIEKYAPSFNGREEIVTKILDEVFIPYLWQSEDTKINGLGYSNIDKWNESIEVLSKYGVIEKEFDATELINGTTK